VRRRALRDRGAVASHRLLPLPLLPAGERRAGGGVGHLCRGRLRRDPRRPGNLRLLAGVERSFCPRCGTPLAYRADFLPGLVDVTVCSLDDPAAEKPTMHYWCAERLAWLRFADALPEHPGFPPEPA